MAHQAFAVQYRMGRRLLMAMKQKAQQGLQKLHMLNFRVNKSLLPCNQNSLGYLRG
jgi:hypothetical protein